MPLELIKRMDKHVRPLLKFDVVSKFEMISGKQKHDSLYEAAPIFRDQNRPLEQDEFIVRNKQTKTCFIHPGEKTLEPHVLRYRKPLPKLLGSSGTLIIFGARNKRMETKIHSKTKNFLRIREIFNFRWLFAGSKK